MNTPVPPVTDGAPRPRWSVMVPTYHCAAYLAETLRSVLAQDPGPGAMQIEVVDDHSTADDPEAVVREVGAGRVGFHRQPANVGHTANFDACLARARGRLVHVLHGDDAVRPGFYDAMGRAFGAAPDVGAAFCRHIFMDDDGHWTAISALEQREAGVLPDWLDKIAVGCRLQAPSMVVRRSVYEHLGGFDRRIRRYGEDWEMWVRIAAHYPVWYEPEPLALYRSRTASLSGTTVRTGENMADLRRTVEIIAGHLPPDRAARLTTAAHRGLAAFALKKALWLLDSGERGAAAAQIRESMRSGRSARTALATGFVAGLWTWSRLGLPATFGPGSPPYVALRKALS